MTAAKFCDWVNKKLLPNTNLPERYPKEIHKRTTTWVSAPKVTRKESILMVMNAAMLWNIESSFFKKWRYWSQLTFLHLLALMAFLLLSMMEVLLQRNNLH